VDFALCGARPTPHGVGSVPPFEKGGRKLEKGLVYLERLFA